MAVGELVSANKCSVPCGKRLPNHKLGMITMQKAPKTSDYDAFAPCLRATTAPNPYPYGFIAKCTRLTGINQALSRSNFSHIIIIDILKNLI